MGPFPSQSAQKDLSALSVLYRNTPLSLLQDDASAFFVLGLSPLEDVRDNIREGRDELRGDLCYQV
jgi:hypothetical protein